MEQYGLIGYPLRHSFSMGFFNDKFKSENIDARYINFEISTVKEFRNIIKENPDLKGLNVTIPYKEQVIPYLNRLHEDAKQIGAVNVIKIERGRKKICLIGFNSDIVGFKESIRALLQPHHKLALVLGTGGAAKAVFYSLKQLGLIPTYVSRRKKLRNILTYKELTAEIISFHTIIVNCTPVGMYPLMDDCPKIPYEFLDDKHLLYDLLYNPDETLFMKLGKERNATVKNGLEMLLLQAVASWDFWHGNEQ
ncbi:shikimate dehydrogenase family protein [Candidatus Azobacteroides pseudotrichonymphae]|uniref:Shikimate 5-dehydrogenase n=1 Tax=Azobacteroides pseudotrichonymphae genomovar. CFP2 TaxID=511995 RepID=B6YRK8_AZOPC|nr:shikimate dehydrogenase [Candidatus Azobacteroides pseudotrichonymphae]BAG83830.1 shikimate 5-dehydrogenase [Candidatus Azobacteroides pseudotrichonymphae genomovar. CFP2]